VGKLEWSADQKDYGVCRAGATAAISNSFGARNVVGSALGKSSDSASRDMINEAI
jgi:hypothetical protein